MGMEWEWHAWLGVGNGRRDVSKSEERQEYKSTVVF